MMRGKKLYKCFFFFVLIFAAFWVTGFILLKMKEGIATLEIILLIIGTTLVLILTIAIFIFFNKQVIKIELLECDNSVEFSCFGGKTYKCNKEDIVEIIDAPSRYVFVTKAGKRLSSYKYYTPRRAMKGENAIAKIVREGEFTEAKVSYKVW